MNSNTPKISSHFFYISRAGQQYIVENNQPIIDEIKKGTMMGGFEIATDWDSFGIYDDFGAAVGGTIEMVEGLLNDGSYEYMVAAFNEPNIPFCIEGEKFLRDGDYIGPSKSILDELLNIGERYVEFMELVRPYHDGRAGMKKKIDELRARVKKTA